MKANKRILTKIGRKIKLQRKLKDYTQEDVAHMANLGLAYYGRIERGEQNMSISCFLEVQKALEVEATALLPSLEELKEE